MNYDFKAWPETVRAIIIAALFYGFTILANFDGQSVSDWKRWVVSVGVGLAHVVGTAALGFFTTPPPSSSAPPR